MTFGGDHGRRVGQNSSAGFPWDKHDAARNDVGVNSDITGLSLDITISRATFIDRGFEQRPLKIKFSRKWSSKRPLLIPYKV